MPSRQLEDRQNGEISSRPIPGMASDENVRLKASSAPGAPLSIQRSEGRGQHELYDIYGLVSETVLTSCRDEGRERAVNERESAVSLSSVVCDDRQLDAPSCTPS